MVFKPLGKDARWRLVFEVLAQAKIGDVVTYEQLGEVLMLNPKRDRHTIQMSVRKAAQVYEEEWHRALTSVTNVGYRVVEPQEHLTLARRHQTRASKSLMRGQSKVVNVDLSGLDSEVRHTFEVVARAFSLQMDFNRRFEVKQERLEQTLSAIEAASTRSEQEIADLKDRLARLEDSQ